MMEAIDTGSLSSYADTHSKDAAAGQFSLFDMVDDGGQDNDLGLESEVPSPSDDE